jgi:hypothetical protein
MPLDRRHLLKQVATLTRLGVNPMDIERTSSWVEAHLPIGADADTWVPTEADLADNGIVSDAATLDARNAWYGDKNVPRRFKRILDARGGA